MSEALVRVYTTASVLEGQLAKGRLEAEGIPVLLKGEGEGPYRMGPVDVYVPEPLEVQARLILEQAEADDDTTREDADARGDDHDARSDRET